MAEQKLIDKIYRQLDHFQRTAEFYGRREFLAKAAKLYEVEKRLTEIVNADDPHDIKELITIHKKVDSIIRDDCKKNEE